MRIAPFGVEIWMNQYEGSCTYNLAETCVDTLTLEELLEITGARDTFFESIRPLRLTYGEIAGSERLRNAISALYETVQPANTIVTHGGIGANSLVYHALINRGDHVISVMPAYQQHQAIPESLGAEVSLLHLREKNDFLPDLDELRAAVRNDTRLICMTNPNNPTGALLEAEHLAHIVEMARRVGAYVLVDEVYRGTDDLGSGTTASIVDLYERGISTSSVSKAFSLAGLRVGWVAGPREVIEAVSIHRDYNTISVGVIDDALATIALESAEQILNRSRSITRAHRKLVDTWIASEDRVHWVRPRSGTTALLRYDAQVNSRDFCVGLMDQAGVLLTPGSTMGMEGYLRIGYAYSRDDLVVGLPLISRYLDSLKRN